MSLPDFINGSYEACGGFFIALSVIKLHRAKVVSGVSTIHVAFFTSWGLWGLYYYPHLDQWMSFWGGILLFSTNAVWLGQVIYYNRINKRALANAIKQGDAFWQPNLNDPYHLMVTDQFGGFDRQPYHPAEFNG